MDNKSISHTRWKCQYHIVFIPQYRKKVLYGKVREDVREILNTLCKYKNVEIIAGAVCVDHVHLSVAIPPKLSVSDFMGYLKGKSTLMLYDRHPELQSKWDKAAFWARGYYVETISTEVYKRTSRRIKKAIDEMEGYSEIIKENIEYDSLLLAHPYDQEMVEGIFDLILETVLSKNGEITIAGDVYPKNLVKSKFLKLNYSHVEYVINCLGKNTTKVRNIKSYLLASLFNAGSTISSYYRAEVNHDMPQYAG